MNNKAATNISLIGLGKLGSCLGTVLAYKGFNVLALDIDRRKVDLLNRGLAPVSEPGLQELIDKSRERLSATTDFSMLMKHADVTFVIVPTPSMADGSFSDEFLKDALKNMAVQIKTKKTHHTVVINSTVTPTTVESELVPFFEKNSGRKIGDGWSICYNPEFIAIGEVIRGLLEPDMVLIGASDTLGGDRLESIYKKLCGVKTPIVRMSLVSAEIAKVALNAYVTMKISFANTLGAICENVPGADAHAVSKALGYDRRISPHFMKPGLPFGGPCFPRDNRAFSAFARQAGVDAPLARATDQVNDTHIASLFEKIRHVLDASKRDSLAIFGLSYKRGTGILEESAIVKVITMLLRDRAGIKITVYDPLAMESARAMFGEQISYAPTPARCAEDSPIWIIASPEEEFKRMHAVNNKHDNVTIIDCWKLLDREALGKKISYMSLGINYDEKA